MLVRIESWLRDEEEFARLRRIDRVQSYECCNSVKYRSLHSVFHSPLKIANIFICALWMTENTSANLNWAITVTEFCYAAILFQSCRNFLLYLDYTFYLLTLQTIFPQFDNMECDEPKISLETVCNERVLRVLNYHLRTRNNYWDGETKMWLKT